jgi:hypothetical protein
MTASSRFAHSDSAGLPCYKCFIVGSSTYPCHMACISKSVAKDIISLSNYVPNSTEVLWMRRVIIRTDHSASFSCNYQGQVHSSPLLVLLLLHRVVLFRHSLCICLPHRNKGCRSQYFKQVGSFAKPATRKPKKREFLVEDT